MTVYVCAPELDCELTTSPDEVPPLEPVPVPEIVTAESRASENVPKPCINS